MLSSDVQRGSPYLRTAAEADFCVSGVIGLSGDAVGTVVLNMSKEVALGVASVLLMEQFTELTPDVIDAVGELTNVIAGAAKSKLEEFRLGVSLPNVITGSAHMIHFPKDVEPICVPFKTAWGPLVLEVGLTPVRQVVAV
jgi:chemotaxis protein CheX